jgi:hypothetical protein
MGDCVRGCRLCTRVTTSFIALWCNNRGGKAASPLAGIVKRCSKHKFTRHPNSSHDMPSTSWDMAIVSKSGLMIAKGPTMLRVPR